MEVKSIFKRIIKNKDKYNNRRVNMYIRRKVSIWLTRLFVLHFIIDMLFAIPLFLFPEYFLTLLGLENFNPLFVRLVAAALFGIGIESLLGRNSSPEVFKAMLNLKIIWSSAAIIGIILSIPEITVDMIILLILGVFIIFNVIWVYWRIKLA